MPMNLTAYYYEDLKKNAQTAALDSMRYINVEHFEWWDSELDYWKEELEKVGFPDAEIFFSGFSSQGDGASFKSGVNLIDWLKANKMCNDNRSLFYWANQGYGHVNVYKMSSHYDHHMTMAVETEWDMWNETPLKAETQLVELEDVILEDARDWAKKIYGELEKVYDGNLEDEYVADTIMANEFLFWDTGKPVH